MDEKIFLIGCFILAVSAIKNCPSNEEFKSCGNCEPTCDNPNPMICSMECRLNVCQCINGYVRNQQGKCIRKEECKEINPCLHTKCPSTHMCQLKNIACFVAPCPKIAECVRLVKRSTQCQANQVFNTCASYCEPTCVKKNPTCISSCAPSKCQCIKGFYRSSSGECVMESEC